MKRIVVGVDGSGHADRAVWAAARLAGQTGADLTLLAVQTLPQALESEAKARASSGDAATRDLPGAYADARPAYLLRARDKAAIAGARGIETTAVVGDPAEEIVDAAKRGEADMIVVGRRGRGQVASLLFGSVSLKTLQLASCPVMIVP